MIFLLMMPAYLIIIGTLFFFKRRLFQTKEEYLFAVRIPSEYRTSQEIVEIMTRLKTKYRRIVWGMTAIAAASLFLKNYPVISSLVMFVWMFVSLGLVERIIIRGYDEVYQYKKEQLSWLLSEEDDDKYWRGGFYKNPADKRLFVEKRIGIGLQTNDARVAAKVMYGITAAILLGICIWLITCIPLDFPVLHLKVQGDEIKVEATQYDTTIDLNEVTHAEIRSQLPKMYRNEGYSGRDHNFGQYRLKEIGQCKVYINDTKGAYLILYTDGWIYILNSDDNKELQSVVNAVESKMMIDRSKEKKPVITSGAEEAKEPEPVVTEEVNMQEEEQIDLSECFHGDVGCAYFYDEAENKAYIYKEEKTGTQYSPCSIFKIVSALAGLKEGVLTSEDSVMGYSGKEYPMPAWNRELTLKEAFSVSCVWYFRKVIDQVGKDKMQQYVDTLHYGNCDLSQWEGAGVNKDSDLDGFWLESSLKISPREQVDALRILFGDTKDYGMEIKVLEEIMKVYEKDGLTVYGKTGTGRGKDGTCDNAWFTGFAEKNGRRIYFAVHLEHTEDTNGLSGPYVKEKTIQILQSGQLPFIK